MNFTAEQVREMAVNVRDCAWPADVKEYMVLIDTPPIDLAAVREVITDLRREAVLLAHDLDSQTYLLDQANKLEAATKGAA